MLSPSHPTLHRLRQLAALGCLVGLLGCEYKAMTDDGPPANATQAETTTQPTDQTTAPATEVPPSQVPTVPNPTPTTATAWRPTPVQLVIYPGTRWQTRQGQPTLSTAIELRDAMGDPTKAAGQLRLQWIQPGQGQQTDSVLNQWTVPLQTMEDQQKHWSAILRAYVFELNIDNAAHAKRNTRLHATFTPAPGLPGAPGGRSANSSNHGDTVAAEMVVPARS